MADIPAYGLIQSKFDEIIADRGKQVVWQAAYRCSCWIVASGSPNAKCKVCSGGGYVYQAPYTSHVLMIAPDTKKEFLPAGEWRNGDITCSVPYNLRSFRPLPPPKQGTEILWTYNSMWTVGEWDLVTLPDSEQRTSENLTRGRTMWKRPGDTLLHAGDSILSITALLVSDPESGAVTYFTMGEVDTDYTVLDDVVTWLPDSTADFTVIGNVVHFNPNGSNAVNLPEGAQYSITYMHHTVYRVYMVVPHARDYDGQNQPRKVMLRLRDVNTQ